MPDGRFCSIDEVTPSSDAQPPTPPLLSVAMVVRAAVRSVNDIGEFGSQGTPSALMVSISIVLVLEVESRK